VCVGGAESGCEVPVGNGWMDAMRGQQVCALFFSSFLSFRAALGFGTTPRYYNYVS